MTEKERDVKTEVFATHNQFRVVRSCSVQNLRAHLIRAIYTRVPSSGDGTELRRRTETNERPSKKKT